KAPNIVPHVNARKVPPEQRLRQSPGFIALNLPGNATLNSRNPERPRVRQKRKTDASPLFV
ncbi:hypothetical protein L2252_21510, partial [Mesorhizobium muleiense]